MIKKLVVVSAVLLLVGGIIHKSNFGSYITTSYRRASSAAQESVPLEFQIDRARNMVKDLEPEIRHSMHVIAKEEVEVGELDKRVEQASAKSEKDKTEIMKLQADLKTGNNVFHYAGAAYTAGEVKE